MKLILNTLGFLSAPQTTIPPLEPTVGFLDDRISPVIPAPSGIREFSLPPKDLDSSISVDITVNSKKILNLAEIVNIVTPINGGKKRQYPQRLPKQHLSPNLLSTSTTTLQILSTLICPAKPTTPTTPTPSVSLAPYRGKRKKKKIRKV